MRDIVATLVSTPRFRTFVTVLVATELIDDLRGPGRFEVLAPPDEAFARLPHAALAHLFARENVETLVDYAESLVRPREPGTVVEAAADGELLVCTNGIIRVSPRAALPVGASTASASLNSCARVIATSGDAARTTKCPILRRGSGRRLP